MAQEHSAQTKVPKEESVIACRFTPEDMSEIRLALVRVHDRLCSFEGMMENLVLRYPSLKEAAAELSVINGSLDTVIERFVVVSC